MDLTLLHPKLVHVPIALAVLIPLIAGGLALAWWRGWLPKRAWIVAAMLQGLLVVSGFAAMQTGEVDEERVEGVVHERHIDAHEDAAETFVWASAGVLALFVVPLFVRPERLALGLASVALLGSVAVFGLGYQVGASGGDLVYVHGAARAFAPGPGVAPSAREHVDSESEHED